MTPVYNLDDPDDCIRLAVDQPTRWRRQAVVNAVRRRDGEEAAQAVLEALREIAKGRAA